MKVKVLITETKEIEVDDNFLDLVDNDEDEKALKMLKEKIDVKLGCGNVTEDEPYVYCVTDEEGIPIYEW
jgi:hypothetical protein